MGKSRNIIRVGDRVRVVNPVVVVRVGYPKCLADYEKEVREKLGFQLTQLLLAAGVPEHELDSSRSGRKILSELAYCLGNKDRWGGRLRSLHTVEVPELRVQDFTVLEMRTAFTGVHESGSGQWDDYSPPCLGHAKAHRLARLGWGNTWWMETCNLEKLQ